MPDEVKKSETKEEKKENMVDIDTSGPGAEVDLPEDKTKEDKPEIEVQDEKTTGQNLLNCQPIGRSWTSDAIKPEEYTTAGTS